MSIKLAELLSSVAKEGAKLGSCGQMCSDCAFKPGTRPNNDPQNMDDVMFCLIRGRKFYCHLDEKGQPLADEVFAKQCVGYQYAKQYYDQKEKE